MSRDPSALPRGRQAGAGGPTGADHAPPRAAIPSSARACAGVAGVGRHELPMGELAMALGGHVRVGLEDNLFVSKGVPARGSAELGSLVVEGARRAGREPATPAQARALLGIAPRGAA